MRPFSEASERNRAPILAVLRRVFEDRTRVLEIGSGTGQHAAYFSAALPHLIWQASDVAENLPGIREWISHPPPIELDVDKECQSSRSMRCSQPILATSCSLWTVQLRRQADIGEQRALRRDAKARDPASGLRDFHAIAALARRHGMALEEDHAMPANNRLLVFQKKLD